MTIIYIIFNKSDLCIKYFVLAVSSFFIKKKIKTDSESFIIEMDMDKHLKKDILNY